MKRPRPARRALLVIACLIPLIAVAAWQVLPPGRDTLTTVTVTRGNIENSVTALGTLQPRRYVDVGAQASGQIRKIHVEAGDQVQEGQLLVEIDPSTQKPSSTPAAMPSRTSRPSCRSKRPSTNWRARSTSASSAWPPATPPAKKMCKPPRPN